MADRFAEVDFTFANLEFPFSSETLVPVRGNIFNVPRQWAGGLVEHSFRVLNLANNHAMDQGERGLFDTIALCRELELICFGAGKNERQAWEPGIIEVDGIRVGFVGASYASVNDSGKTWKRFVARIESKHRLKAAIEGMRKDGVDYVVATMHAGIEYVPKPFGPQELFAEAALRFGADIVIGAHPHVVQPAVRRKGRWVFYSLGNFIFDQTDPHTDEGAALDITLTRTDEGVTLTRLEVLPVVIEKATPRLAKGARAEAILTRMKLDGPLLEEAVTQASPDVGEAP
jgi:poly-gamma-glutamate synthesis protein (capsule biosynthesis protein)